MATDPQNSLLVHEPFFVSHGSELMLKNYSARMVIEVAVALVSTVWELRGKETGFIDTVNYVHERLSSQP